MKIILKKGYIYAIIFLLLQTSIIPVIALNQDSDLSNGNISYDGKNIEINDEIITKRVQIDFSTPQFISEEEFVKLVVKEANSYTLVQGRPMIPIYNAVFNLPIGSEVVDVKCIFSSFETISLSKKILPVNNPISNGIMGDYSNYILDAEILENIDWYPLDLYDYSTGAGLENNNHVTFLSIQVYPVIYSPKNDLIKYTKNVEIIISYKEPITNLFSNDAYDLLIIAPSEYSSYLSPLINHKNNHGISTKLVNVEDIGGQGQDKQEQIKYFIKESIENWGIKYVLLVGSIDKLPIRQTYVGDSDPLTDLYYADIYFPDLSFSSWDTNGNGRYGEYWQANDDIVDLYADVYIGRLACTNKNEVRNVVNKIIDYETSTYGKIWFDNIILAAGDTHPYGGIYEGEVTANYILNSMSEFNPIKLFASEGTFTARTLNKAINDGAGFLSYSGHGFEYGLGTHPPNSDEWIYYYQPYLIGLFNKDKLPIVYFDACLTARFDFVLGNLLKLPFIKIPLPCIAWSFVKKPMGGAIAAIGATRVAFSMVDDDGPQAGSGYLALQFFKNYEKGIKISEMFVSAQNDYLNNLWYDPMTIEEFTLIGDPTLMIGGYNE